MTYQSWHILYYIILDYIILCYIILYYTILYYIIFLLYYINIILHYILLYYIILYVIILYVIILYVIILYVIYIYMFVYIYIYTMYMHTAIPRYAATAGQVLDWWIFGTGLCQHPLHPRSLRSIFRAATSNGSARDRTWVCHGLSENRLRKMDPHGYTWFINVYHTS